jgi:hypothetical protein
LIQRAAAPLQMRQRCKRAVYDTPKVRLEQLPLIVERHVGKPAVDRHAGVIDPRVEAAEALHRTRGGGLQCFEVRHVGDPIFDLGAASGQLGGELAQVAVATRDQHQPRPFARGEARGGETDATGRAGDHDGLLFEWFEFHHLELQ